MTTILMPTPFEVGSDRYKPDFPLLCDKLVAAGTRDADRLRIPLSKGRNG